MWILSRGFVELRFDRGKFVVEHGFEQGHFAWEMGVKCFFADTQLFRQIVRGNATEPVTKEVGPGCLDDLLPGGISGLVSGRGFWRRFHIFGLDTIETTLVYLVSVGNENVQIIFAVTDSGDDHDYAARSVGVVIVRFLAVDD